MLSAALRCVDTGHRDVISSLQYLEAGITREELSADERATITLMIADQVDTERRGTRGRKIRPRSTNCQAPGFLPIQWRGAGLGFRSTACARSIDRVRRASVFTRGLAFTRVLGLRHECPADHHRYDRNARDRIESGCIAEALSDVT